MGTSKLVLEDLLLFLAFGTKFFEKFRFELGYSMKGLQYEFLSSKSHPPSDSCYGYSVVHLTL